MKRTKTRASLLALGMGATALLITGSAQAKDPEIYFYPQKKWAVSSSHNAGYETCAVINEFNNGFTVQFSGSHKWVETMDIDFRQSAFEPGKSYDVNLSVPGQDHKTLKATASNPSTISIRMTGNKDLYQSVRDSSIFDFKVDNNEFRFYMVGFAAVSKNFERCMADSKKDTKSAQTDSAPSALSVSASDVETVDAEPTFNETVALEEKETLIMSGALEIDDPVAPTDTENKTSSGLQETTQKDTTSGAGPVDPSAPIIAPKSHKRLSDMLAKKIEENPEIASIDDDAPLEMSMSQQSRAEGKKSADVSVPEPDNDSLLPTPDDLEEHVVEAPPAVPLGTSDNTPDTKRKRTKVDVPAGRDVTVHKKTASIEADFTDIGLNKAPTKSGEEPFSQFEHDDSDAMSSGKLANLERRIRELEHENIALNDELETSLQESKHEQMSVSSENWNLERATARYNEAERQMKKLGQQLQQERAQCKVEKEELEAMLFDPEVTSEKQLAKLADLNQKLTVTEAKLEKALARIKDLESRGR